MKTTKIIALVTAMVMLVAMIPFAQTSVYADGTLTEAELLTNSSEVVQSYDTDEELGTIRTYGDGTYAISEGVLTLTGNGDEDFVYSAINSFSDGSMLHIKINGVTNATHTHPVLYLHDENNPYCLITFQNQTINFGGAAYDAVNTSQPFEMVMKKTVNGSAISYEVYARQNATDNFDYLGNMNAITGWVSENRFEFYASGDNSIAIDYIKVYGPKTGFSFDELINSALNEEAQNFDTDAELGTISTYGDGTYAISDGVLTLTGNGSEDFVYSSIGSFSNESMLHIKINGVTNATHTHPVLYLHDENNPYCLITFQNQAINFGGAAYDAVNTSQPFEMVIKKLVNGSAISYEVYARQNATDNFDYLGNMNAITGWVSDNRFEFYASGGNSIAIDYIKVYSPKSATALPKINAAFASSDYALAKQYIVTDYAVCLDIAEETMADYNALLDKNSVFVAMTGAPYADFVAVVSAFAASVEAQTVYEAENVKSFDDLIGTNIANQKAEAMISLDTTEDFAAEAGLSGCDTANGILTLPATDGEFYVRGKNNGFRIGSALHFKIDGFEGANNNTAIQPNITTYWVEEDGSGYYFIFGFVDMAGKPVMAYNEGGAHYITNSGIDTTQPFEVLIRRTAQTTLEIWARQSASQDARYAKIATSAPTAGTWENRINITSKNGQSVKFDYIKYYEDREKAIVDSFNSLVNASNYSMALTTLNYYSNAFEIPEATMIDYDALTDTDAVFEAMKPANYATFTEVREAFAAAVAAQKIAQAKDVITTSLALKEGSFRADIHLENNENQDSAKNVILIFAAYDNNNRMLSAPQVKTVEVTYQNDIDEYFTLADNSNIKTVKLFVWEGQSLATSYLEPLCASTDYIKE